MRVTLKQIYFGYQTLSKIITQELPIKIAFKMSKIIKVLSDEYALIEKQRNQLVAKHGEQQESGEVKVKKENTEIFLSEFEDLLTETVELNIEKIKINNFPETFKINVQDITLIDFLLEQ
jgi:hypothetical protein